MVSKRPESMGAGQPDAEEGFHRVKGHQVPGDAVVTSNAATLEALNRLVIGPELELEKAVQAGKTDVVPPQTA